MSRSMADALIIFSYTKIIRKSRCDYFLLIVNSFLSRARIVCISARTNFAKSVTTRRRSSRLYNRYTPLPLPPLSLSNLPRSLTLWIATFYRHPDSLYFFEGKVIRSDYRIRIRISVLFLSTVMVSTGLPVVKICHSRSRIKFKAAVVTKRKNEGESLV